MSTSERTRGDSSRFSKLSLFYKLLVPFVALVLIVGAFGAFLIVRNLTARARATLNQDLLQASLKARAVLLDRELYLLESANLAANLEGMTEAVGAGRRRSTANLLRSVLALKTDVDLVAIATTDGGSLVKFSRARAKDQLAMTVSGRLGAPFVTAAMSDPQGDKRAGFVVVGGRRMLAIAAPICSRSKTCAPVGAAVVGLLLDNLAGLAAGIEASGGQEGGLTIFDDAGRVLATSGDVPGKRMEAEFAGADLMRRTEKANGHEVHTLYAPFEVQGEAVGSVAVSLPTGPVFAAVRGAGLRLALVVLVVLAGIVAIGAALSRLILRQIGALVETNRALGRGDLSARAPVVSQDEIGEVARGLNEMAAQLQASHETLEMRVAERTEEIERLLNERTEFFASLSHELRTPIAIIINQAQFLVAEHGKKGRWWVEPGTTIHESAGELLAFVNDILDLARFEAGGIWVDLAQVELGQVLDGVRATLEGLASQADIRLKYEVPRDLPPITADARRVREVVLNLIDNAVKYTPAGGEVELAAEASNRHVNLTVKDTGVGISKEDLERIFDPFYRVPGIEPQRGQAASGLGLALTKRLVEAQDGEIRVTSTKGVGSVFTVRLPAPGATTAESP